MAGKERACSHSQLHINKYTGDISEARLGTEFYNSARLGYTTGRKSVGTVVHAHDRNRIEASWPLLWHKAIAGRDPAVLLLRDVHDTRDGLLVLHRVDGRGDERLKMDSMRATLGVAGARGAAVL